MFDVMSALEAQAADPRVWAILSILLPQGVDMPKDWSRTSGVGWYNPTEISSDSYRCGYCSNDVASGKGMRNESNDALIRLCPQCNCPTFFDIHGEQWPGPKVGGNVAHLPESVKMIYEETRNSVSVNAPTGAVMLCRKILMHVAVEKGADENLSFQAYVEWLIKERWVPRGAEAWLDYIRERGNFANHEIVVMMKNDALGLLRFTEALLHNVYELEKSVPPAAKP